MKLGSLVGLTAVFAPLSKSVVQDTPAPCSPRSGSVFGYVQAKVTKEILQKACDSKDLTRQGVLAAMRQLSGLDTGGLIAGTIDYTKNGQPPSRSVYISQVGASAPGGLKVVEGLMEAAPAKTYQAGA